MRSVLVLGTCAVFFLACRAAPPAPSAVAPVATAACSGPGDDLVLDAAMMSTLERSPDVARDRLAPRATAPDAGLCLRFGYALARWSSTPPGVPFAAWLPAQGINASDADRDRALLRLTSRAIDERATGVATVLYAAWLAPKPRGPALDAEGRATALKLVELQSDAQEYDLEEKTAEATLEHDPEFAKLARALVEGFQGEDIVAFLRKWNARAHAPSWIGAIARDLPMLTTRAELEEPAVRERIARAMGELGGVAPEEARRELAAALASLQDGGAATKR